MVDDRREPSMNPAQSETPGMLGNSMRENREARREAGSSTPERLEKATSYKTSSQAGGESDERVVPAKRSNNGEQSPAESVEGSRSTKGNTEEAHTRRTQGRERVSQGLGGVRGAARRDKKQKGIRFRCRDAPFPNCQFGHVDHFVEPQGRDSRGIGQV